jgi:hypothetical protein
MAIFAAWSCFPHHCSAAAEIRHESALDRRVEKDPCHVDPGTARASLT